MHYNVYCDGSITGGAWGKKTGPRTVPHGWSGWVIKREDGSVLAHHSIDLGEAEYMSGNIAEYMALRSALRWLVDKKLGSHTQVKIHSDSQLIVNQMKGSYGVGEKLVGLRDHCRQLAAQLPHVIYQWVPREQNRYADYMSKVFQHGDTIPPVPVDPDVIERWR